MVASEHTFRENAEVLDGAPLRAGTGEGNLVGEVTGRGGHHPALGPFGRWSRSCRCCSETDAAVEPRLDLEHVRVASAGGSRRGSGLATWAEEGEEERHCV